MMKKLLAAAALTIAATAAHADPVFGDWRSQPGETGGYIHVNIAQCGTQICGTITKVVGNDNQSIVGRQIIAGMKKAGGNKYADGTIWAPDQDRTYKSQMELNGNSLKVTGCVGICTALTSRSQTWTRL
ncbi:MAG: DUF2147 domain-containing protein [Shimia sp.]